jgi:hypothetical protein
LFQQRFNITIEYYVNKKSSVDIGIEYRKSPSCVLNDIKKIVHYLNENDVSFPLKHIVKRGFVLTKLNTEHKQILKDYFQRMIDANQIIVRLLEEDEFKYWFGHETN